MSGFKQEHRILYSAMDIFPSAKGAATHIQYFAKALLDWAGDLGLITLGDEIMPFYDSEDNLELIRFNWLFNNYLERSMAWSSFVQTIAENQNNLEFIQFRDPWSGIALQRKKGIKIFEINALPSLELPMIYPLMPQSTREKITLLEKDCITSSDCIITPSHTLANYLIFNGVQAEKIQIIPNGFDPSIENAELEPITDPYIIYFGALQPWQGVDILLRAFARVRVKDLKLLICASNRKQNAKLLQKLAIKLGIQDRVIWVFELKKPELKTRIQGALASIAPLTSSARNTIQGCNPLKIIESAGYGTPIIASDLPVVGEILSKEMYFDCKPDHSSELARMIEHVCSATEERKTKAILAQNHVLGNFTWQKSSELLISTYKNLQV